ncbi:MAG: zincin-like metallopeptidase domain-containing protein [Paracoccaceae bacterium]|nr:zincin-like metallopeptidase domain-containing protein [Paracoccaceae bacterium]
MANVYQESPDQLFEDVTAWLIRELENGNAPWIKPWSSRKVRIGGQEYPVNDWPSNIRSPTRYYGTLNHLLLSHQMHCRKSMYRSNFWITPDALEKLGATPKKPPYFALSFFQATSGGSACTYRKLFHIEQVRDCEQTLGLSFPKPEKREVIYKESQRALDALKRWMDLEIYEGTGYAAFNPVTEVVLMPGLGQFVADASDAHEGEAHYWSTLWHEVIHWTGNHRRLDRPMSCRSDENGYALEELVAETGSAYLCMHFGITGRLQHPEYIASWLAVLKEERGDALRTAFEAAQKAAKWIIDNSRRRRSNSKGQKTGFHHDHSESEGFLVAQLGSNSNT